MKRTIAFILTILMITMYAAVPAFAEGSSHFTDVAEDASYASAVEALYEKGIMVGDENGLFKPDASITRAEFATIVCRILDAENAAKELTASKFTDVPGNHWAVGYVAKASALGIINGMGNNVFAPSSPVTVEQAAKMLVCAWGHGSDAEALGSYPAGYLAEAAKMGIIEADAANTSAAATRSRIAEMVYATLQCTDKKALAEEPADTPAESPAQTQPDPIPANPAPYTDNGSDQVSVASITVGEIYNLINKKSGLGLGIYGADNSSGADSNMLLLKYSDTNKNQKFKVLWNDSGWYELEPQSNTKLLVTVNSLHPTSTTNVQVDTKKKRITDTQGWKIEKVGDYYLIRSVCNEDLVLTAMDTSANTRIKVTTYQAGNENQLWVIK